ncbi:MAG: hypothetical protein PVG65_00445 [Candidatus Thorarchaeota archaeon]|jgi:hypothetical protein
MNKKDKELLQFYEQGFRDGATSVLKNLDRLIPSYLTDSWKHKLYSKKRELEELFKKRKK